MPVNNLIQLRRGSDWSTNPVLSSGEPGFDIPNNQLKIGDFGLCKIMADQD